MGSQTVGHDWATNFHFFFTTVAPGKQKKDFEGENIRNRLNSLQIILKSERVK